MHVFLEIHLHLFLSGSIVRWDHSRFYQLIGLRCSIVGDEGIIEMLREVVHYN